MNVHVLIGFTNFNKNFGLIGTFINHSNKILTLNRNNCKLQVSMSNPHTPGHKIYYYCTQICSHKLYLIQWKRTKALFQGLLRPSIKMSFVIFVHCSCRYETQGLLINVKFNELRSFSLTYDYSLI